MLEGYGDYFLDVNLSSWGFSFDSFLGELYLPWITIVVGWSLVLAYKIIKRKRRKG
jgi:hypothetical protein